jgi:hypothetical protein
MISARVNSPGKGIRTPFKNGWLFPRHVRRRFPAKKKRRSWSAVKMGRAVCDRYFVTVRIFSNSPAHLPLLV